MQVAASVDVRQVAAFAAQTDGEQVLAGTPTNDQNLVSGHSVHVPFDVFKRYPELHVKAEVVVAQDAAFVAHAEPWQVLAATPAPDQNLFAGHATQ